MFRPIRVVPIEITRPLPNLDGLERYAQVHALVRRHGIPLGYVQVNPIDGRCSAAALREAIMASHGQAMLMRLVADRLAAPAAAVYTPLVTVAVCTRDRTDDLARCLEALGRLEYPSLDLLVVDNAPCTDATARLVREHYPRVRYVWEPRPGLDWARNRAISAARGEIVAFTDDDVVVDPGWVAALVRVFAEDPHVMAATGMVAPYELETEAQVLFERHGGFTSGVQRREYRVRYENGERAAGYGHMGKYGAGANMAYRRAVFEAIGGFDPALDVGTVTNGGGDLEMFFRVLKAGHTLVYEPGALVWHRHRREYEQLRNQIADHGIAFVSVLVRCATAWPEERAGLLRIGLWWMHWWLLRRLLLSFLRPSRFRRDLILAELRGAAIGLVRYKRARRDAAQIERFYGSLGEAAVRESLPL